MGRIRRGGGEGESGLLRPNQASANICNRRLPLPGDGIPWMEGGNSRDSSLPPPLLLPWERKQEIGLRYRFFSALPSFRKDPKGPLCDRGEQRSPFSLSRSYFVQGETEKRRRKRTPQLVFFRKCRKEERALLNAPLFPWNPTPAETNQHRSTHTPFCLPCGGTPV